MDNSSSRPATDNPQNAVNPSQKTYSAEGFQGAASEEALKGQADQISVEQTGDPLASRDYSAVAPSNEFFTWMLVVIVLVIAGGLLLARLIKESNDELGEVIEETSVKSAATKTSSKKVTSKKKSDKKKSAPNQRRKKTAKQKR